MACSYICIVVEIKCLQNVTVFCCGTKPPTKIFIIRVSYLRVCGYYQHDSLKRRSVQHLVVPDKCACAQIIGKISYSTELLP